MQAEPRRRAFRQGRAIAALALLAACTPFAETTSQVDTGDAGPTGVGDGSREADALPPDSPSGGCYALLFDGKDDHVDVSDAADLDSAGPSTVEAWIRMDVVDTAEHQIVSHHEHPTSGYLLMAFGVGTNTQTPPLLGATVRYYAPGAAPSGYTQVGGAGSSLITPMQWTHVAATFDGVSTLRVWVDGMRKGESVAALASANYGGLLRIGRSAATGTHAFGGLIDEVRISKMARYDTAFTPEKVFTNDGNTIALWHFDEGSGTETRDAANKHDGTIVGATWTKVDCTSRAPL